MRLRSIFSHSAQALAEGALISLLVVGLMAGTAFAAKPAASGGGHNGGTTSGGGTISLVLMDGATDAHFTARVTFAISTTATPYPYVHLTCRQNGTLVLEGRQGFFSTAIGNKWFILGPTPLWQSGAADCTANLEKPSAKGGWSVLASTPAFHVYE
jgi:hypothetical protein